MKMEPTDFWNDFWKIKGIPNPSNTLFRYVNKALPGVFPPLNAEEIFFNSEGGRKVGNIGCFILNFWNTSSGKGANLAVWDYNKVWDSANMAGSYLSWLAIVLHCVWKQHCDFTHGKDMWSARRIANWIYYEWEGMGDIILNDSPNKKMRDYYVKRDFDIIEKGGKKIFRRTGFYEELIENIRTKFV